MQLQNFTTSYLISSDGCPSNRFVLLKDVTAEGFTFFTNYGSRKAQDIASNPNVAMTLYWCPLRRSIRIEGIAEKIPQEDSLKYFHQRPRASQIGALASEQSSRIPSRQHLDDIEKKLKQELGDDKEVPLPNWGGYLIKPKRIEFWQGQTDRLHDRIVFRKSSGSEKVIDIGLSELDNPVVTPPNLCQNNYWVSLTISIVFFSVFRKSIMFWFILLKMVGFMNV